MFIKLFVIGYAMLLQNWWEKTLLQRKPKFCDALQGEISCDSLVIGGGVAGLHAALTLVENGKDVVLIEKNTCGSSSSGRSSGFLTPDSELEMYQMIRRYGLKGAQKVWSIPTKGVALIAETAQKYHIDCDLEVQDSLFVGLGKKGRDAVQEEVIAHKKMKRAYQFYDEKQLQKIMATDAYTAGIRTGETYGINMMLYCYGLKEVLLKKGVRMYEQSAVEKFVKNTAYTSRGSVRAKHIIVCVDKMKKRLSPVAKKAYHAQTFLAVSKPLTKEHVAALFPDGKVMVWDNKLIYTYFRLTKDNRLLVGGGSVLTTYDPWFFESPIIIKQVIRSVQKKFSPLLDTLEFECYWPGLIDITKDIMPMVDYDPENKAIQYVLGNPGLPWAAFCGTYAAEKVLGGAHDWSKYLRMDRKFFVTDGVQCILGKIPSFALNNVYSKYLQKDEK